MNYNSQVPTELVTTPGQPDETYYKKLVIVEGVTGLALNVFAIYLLIQILGNIDVVITQHGLLKTVGSLLAIGATEVAIVLILYFNSGRIRELVDRVLDYVIYLNAMRKSDTWNWQQTEMERPSRRRARRAQMRSKN